MALLKISPRQSGSRKRLESSDELGMLKVERGAKPTSIETETREDKPPCTTNRDGANTSSLRR